MMIFDIFMNEIMNEVKPKLLKRGKKKVVEKNK